MGRSTRPFKYVQQYQINPNVARGKYVYEKINGSPLILNMAGALAALPTAAAAQVDTILTRGGVGWEMYQTTAQTLGPAYTSGSGLEIALDQVDNESVEYVPGGNNTFNPLARTLPSSTAAGDTDFFFRAKFTLTDASGMDQFGIGWRKQEAFAVPTSFAVDGIYTDFALFGFAGTAAAANPVRIATDLNNGGTATVTTTGFTWADGLTHELQIRVIGRRAFFLINGIMLGNPVAKDGNGAAITSQNTLTGPVFSFDAGDQLVPFIFCRQDADLTPAFLVEYEIGALVDVGLDPNQE